MIDYKSTNAFELAVMDLMDTYKEKIKDTEDVARFSDELHSSIEVAIEDMLRDGFNGIDPDEYEGMY